MMQFLPLLLEGLGAAGTAGAAGGSGGLMAALGGGGMGTMAGTPMTGGMVGPTQGSGLMGALSGGGFNPMSMMGGAPSGGEQQKPEGQENYFNNLGRVRDYGVKNRLGVL